MHGTYLSGKAKDEHRPDHNRPPSHPQPIFTSVLNLQICSHFYDTKVIVKIVPFTTQICYMCPEMDSIVKKNWTLGKSSHYIKYDRGYFYSSEAFDVKPA